MYDKEKNPFYDTNKWKMKRSNILKRDDYQCRECKRFGRLSQAEMVHHIYPMKDYTDYKLIDANLISCCNVCHNTLHDRGNDGMTEQGKHWQRKMKKAIGITDQQVIDTFKVIIVWGSPASGKTTYVKEHMNVADMVVDLDMIKQGISMQPKTSMLPSLLTTSLNIRSYIYDMISKREVIKADNVWIVAGLPKLTDREYLIDKLRANEVVHIDTDEATCIKQAMSDDDRLNKNIQIEIIKNFFLNLNQ